MCEKVWQDLLPRRAAAFRPTGLWGQNFTGRGRKVLLKRAKPAGIKTFSEAQFSFLLNQGPRLRSGHFFPRLFFWLISQSSFYYSISSLKQLLLNNWFQAISKGHLIHCSLFWLKPLYSNTGMHASQPGFLRTIVCLDAPETNKQTHKGISYIVLIVNKLLPHEKMKINPIGNLEQKKPDKRAHTAWVHLCEAGK